MRRISDSMAVYPPMGNPFQSHITEESSTSEAAATASNGAEDEIKVDKDDETASNDLSPLPRNGLKLPRLSPSGNVVPTAPDLLCQAASNIANPSPYFINPMYQINSPMFKMDLAGSATADQKQRAVVAAAAAAAAAAAVHQQLDDTNAAAVRHHQKRNRTFIDPVTEVPRLEDWFSQNSHPSHQQICFYTEELNKLTYRHKFPKLEHKNVQFWFKNRRAKCKRLSAPHLGLHSAVSSSLAAAAGYTSASMSPHESRIQQSSPPI